MRRPFSFPTSLRFALQGLLWAHRTQRNLRIQVAAAFAAGLACAILAVSPWELALVALSVAGVLCAELLNTAVEVVVDLASPGLHPLAKIAKDVAAGAVVMACLGASVAGVAIFGPKLHPLALREGGWVWAILLAGAWASARSLLPRLVDPRGETPGPSWGQR